MSCHRLGIALLLFGGVAVPAPGTGAEPVGIDPATVDRLAAEALQRWQVPGLAVVIVREDRPLVVKGYGTRRVGREDPVTAETLFPLGSCTKAFTSAAAAALVQERRIDWDDRIHPHLPECHLSDPHADALVTLRDLLSHRTGIAGHDLLWYRAPWDQQEVIRRISQLPLEYPFRGGYHYTSLGYIAAGAWLERRVGQSWPDLVRSRVTDPLGMTGVRFTAPEGMPLSGHCRAADDRPEPMPAYDLSVPNAAGSLFITPKDLVLWLRFHLSPSAPPALQETKTPQTIMRMTPELRATYPDTRQASYAMGWVVYDHRGEWVVAHGGKIDGFRAQVTLLPERKLGIALLNNLHETKMNIALTNEIIDHALGLPPRDWHDYYRQQERAEQAEKRQAIARREQFRKPEIPPSLPRIALTGRYHDPAYGVSEVTLIDGELIWQWSGFRSPLEHFQENVFRVREGYFAEALIEFVVEKGSVAALRAMGREFRRPR
jgi:CubicO group peptidase (beta-lactamase class C family)